MKLGVVGVPFLAMACLPLQGAAGASVQAAATAQSALSQCVVMRTTGADRVLTAQWMFAAMAKSPQIADLSAVTAQRKVEIDKAFGQLITRIVMKDCLDQVRPLAAEGLEDAFGLVGSALGEVAMRELLENENVDKAIGAYTDYVSEDDFKPLIDSIAKGQSK